MDKQDDDKAKREPPESPGQIRERLTRMPGKGAAPKAKERPASKGRVHKGKSRA